MILSTFVLLLLAAAVGQTPEEPIRFRVASEAVQVDVFVERNGKVVHGLNRDDFELYDNGLANDLALADVTQIPLNIALVLDTSVSVQGSKLENLQTAAHVFLDALEDTDRVALVTFSQRLSLTRGSAPGDVHEAIDAVQAGGTTAWHDALFTGLKIVEGTSDRPVVLLFTDGDDTSSWLRDDQMALLIDQSHAVLFAIRNDEAGETRGSDLLHDLAEASGGRLIETDTTERLQQAFLEILSEMKTRYRLVYRPPEPIQQGWHDIEVRVKSSDAEVRARRGYFYESRD